MDQASVPVKVKRHFKARDFWKLLWLALRNGLAVVYTVYIVDKVLGGTDGEEGGKRAGSSPIVAVAKYLVTLGVDSK